MREVLLAGRNLCPSALDRVWPATSPRQTFLPDMHAWRECVVIELPCPALPCPALPCLALPCLALLL